jgi:hypothetical protein
MSLSCKCERLKWSLPQYQQIMAYCSCFGADFLPFVFCHPVSRRSISSLETVNVLRTAMSNRSASVSPGTLRHFRNQRRLFKKRAKWLFLEEKAT